MVVRPTDSSGPTALLKPSALLLVSFPEEFCCLKILITKILLSATPYSMVLLAMSDGPQSNKGFYGHLLLY